MLGDDEAECRLVGFEMLKSCFNFLIRQLDVFQLPLHPGKDLFLKTAA